MTSPARTRFQSLPNKRSEFLQLDDLGEEFVEEAARLTQ